MTNIQINLEFGSTNRLWKRDAINEMHNVLLCDSYCQFRWRRFPRIEITVLDLICLGFESYCQFRRWRFSRIEIMVLDLICSKWGFELNRMRERANSDFELGNKMRRQVLRRDGSHVFNRLQRRFFLGNGWNLRRVIFIHVMVGAIPKWLQWFQVLAGECGS